MVALLRDALKAMAAALPKPQAINVAPDGFEKWRDAVRVIQAHEIWQVYGRFVEEKKPRFGPGVAERMQIAAKITKAEADAASAVRAAAREHIRALIKPGTIMALPTAPCIAPKIDTPQDALESFRMRVMRLTCIAGLGGLPQMSVPAGTVSGCPVGLSFIGWAGGDEALLDLAVAVCEVLRAGKSLALSACAQRRRAAAWREATRGSGAATLVLALATRHSASKTRVTALMARQRERARLPLASHSGWALKA